MKYTIFTDPHIGTSRSSHTTRESAKRLKSQLTKAAQDIVSRGCNMICVGDLFDKAFNSEEVLLDGLDIASRCNYVLAGNHDLSNREGQITSIDFLSTLCESVIKCGKLSEPFFYPTDDKLMFVPHHASQEVFENALKLAYEHADDGDYLFLHCNYDAPFQIEDNTLNLTEEMAHFLCTKFKYIFLGHEHHSSTKLDGRVIILGNTYPTSFSDICDKYVYILDTDTGELSKELIFSEKKASQKIRYGMDTKLDEEIVFVDVIGHAPNTIDLSNFIAKLWEDNPQCFAIRNSCQVDTINFMSAAEYISEKVELKDRISAELSGEMLSLFNELVSENETN